MYVVKYKLQYQFWWTVLENIQADGIVEPTLTHRWFMNKDGHVTEIPLEGTRFYFDQARQKIIAAKNESPQPPQPAKLETQPASGLLQ